MLGLGSRGATALVLVALLAAGCVGTASPRDCLSRTYVTSGEQAESPNWLVGFHRVPGSVREGGTYMGARVESVDPELRVVAVTAESDVFPRRACQDPQVEYVAPNVVNES